MSRSSGQFVTTTTRDVTCDGTSTHRFPLFSEATFTTSWPCTFEGEVDVTVDPEAMWAGWTCPACDTQHDIDWAEFLGGDAA